MSDSQELEEKIRIARIRVGEAKYAADRWSLDRRERELAKLEAQAQAAAEAEEVAERRAAVIATAAEAAANKKAEVAAEANRKQLRPLPRSQRIERQR